MNKGLSLLEPALKGYLWGLVGSLLLSVALVAAVLLSVGVLAPWTVLLIVCATVVSLVLQIGTYITRKDYHRYRRIAYQLHNINHLYRDVLGAFYIEPSQEIDERELYAIELRTLEKACRHISNAFLLATGKTCSTIVYTVATNDSNAQVAMLWACSDLNTARERLQPTVEFDLNRDSRFKALVGFSASRYYCTDITSEKDYHDSLQDFERFYRSVMVVPLRSATSDEKSGEKPEVIGFLSVDCPSAKRLNNKDHLELLSAFADQMFTFISFRRPKMPSISNSSTIPNPSHSTILDLRKEYEDHEENEENAGDRIQNAILTLRRLISAVSAEPTVTEDPHEFRLDPSGEQARRLVIERAGRTTTQRIIQVGTRFAFKPESATRIHIDLDAEILAGAELNTDFLESLVERFKVANPHSRSFEFLLEVNSSNYGRLGEYMPRLRRWQIELGDRLNLKLDFELVNLGKPSSFVDMDQLYGEGKYPEEDYQSMLRSWKTPEFR
jgi:hypothetical protein